MRISEIRRSLLAGPNATAVRRFAKDQHFSRLVRMLAPGPLSPDSSFVEALKQKIQSVGIDAQSDHHECALKALMTFNITPHHNSQHGADACMGDASVKALLSVNSVDVGSLAVAA